MIFVIIYYSSRAFYMMYVCDNNRWLNSSDEVNKKSKIIDIGSGNGMLLILLVIYFIYVYNMK